MIEAASLPGIAGAKSSSIRVIWYIRAIRDRSPEAMRWMHSQETSRIAQIVQISQIRHTDGPNETNEARNIKCERCVEQVHRLPLEQ